MRLSGAITRFDRQLAANGRSPGTRSVYGRDLRALARWVGGDPTMGKFTPETIARYLTSPAFLTAATGRPRNPITINRTKSVLRSFFGFCVDSGWMKANPARLVRSSRTTAREPATLTEAEIRRLRQAVSGRTGTLAQRDRLILELLLGTGIRLGSLVALNRRDVDLQSGVLHIQTKGNGRDRVFLNPLLARMLGRFLRKVAPQGNGGPPVPLIQGQSGSRLGPRQVQLRFAQWCREAGITRPVSVHSLRHTFATRLYRKTGDLHLVQRALGHRHVTTTEIYARVSDGVLRHVVAARRSQTWAGHPGRAST